ncbi:MFS transporter [Nocardia veterana]|uniref:MFS transporter n=1 Tax=Nocardia veterana TaxID=132249 RepID=A0A7X6LU14_9NOCA|nr:MFS transporter [Nocardia veterana]NKY84594.1 MFS transporter [Nocardia veterana]
MTASTLVDTRPTPTATAARAWWGVAAAVFAIAWGGNEFTPLLVMYKNDGLPVTTVNLLLFEYVLGIVPALLIGGPLSDRYGRRRLMCPAPLITALGSTLLAFGAGTVPMLSIGRVLCGIGLGLAMAVGSSWVKELSQPPFASASAPGTGARRSAMSLTGGFAIGAGLAGVLAQWAPWPATLAYLINVALCLIAAVWVLRAPETVATQRTPQPLWEDLRIPAAGHRRFRAVALPLALWLFTSAAAAYAILPTLAADRVAGTPIAFSALITVITLGCGFAIQSVARRIDLPGTARIAVLSLVLTTAGMGAAVYAAATLHLWAVVATAAVLGFGFGIGMVAGLQEIERIARPDDLAGLTAVFYSVSYLGFGSPALLSLLHNALHLGYPVMFAAGAVIALACLAVVVNNYRDPDATTAAVPAGRRVP